MVTYARPVFEAIADPTRRAILDLLRAEEMPAGEVARRFTVSRPAISRHLRVLRTAGLVRERRDAQQRLYSLAPEPLREVDRWLDGYRVFWSARLLDLKRVVEAKERARPARRESGSGQSPAIQSPPNQSRPSPSASGATPSQSPPRQSPPGQSPRSGR